MYNFLVYSAKGRTNLRSDLKAMNNVGWLPYGLKMNESLSYPNVDNIGPFEVAGNARGKRVQKGRLVDPAQTAAVQT